MDEGDGLDVVLQMTAGLLETPAAGRGAESEKAEHQYKASALLLRGLLIFSMFFRIMSCNVTFTEEKKEQKISIEKACVRFNR